jgi:hypothetical protein
MIRPPLFLVFKEGIYAVRYAMGVQRGEGDEF